jgi:GAF domain-containing protein
MNTSLSSEEALQATLAYTLERTRLLQREGRPLREILTHVAAAAEAVAGPGCVASILVLDEAGLLRNGASPNLPADYLDAIDRLKPHADLGTCASAAATGNVVVTPDFQADSKWAELRHLPSSLGFVGAWSMPIKDRGGRVLGTLGTYYREKREPTSAERSAVERLAAMAAAAIERSIPPDGNARVTFARR